MRKWLGRNLVILTTMIALLWIGSYALRAQELGHITADDLKKIIESGDKSILIVDVQPKGAYELGHIKGAINFPWASDLKNAGDLPKDKTLILYCDCSHEEDSMDVAGQLKDKWGYTNIKLLEGGWSNWLKLGYPTEK
jgi:rhodanese-related sulfurtransferase